MKTWKLVSGIISMVLSLIIIVQSCAMGVLEAMGASGNDSGSFGKSERKGSSANSDGAIRRGGRCGAGCCVSCIRAGRIHYRAGALRRRRHGDVIIIAPLEKEEV